MELQRRLLPYVVMFIATLYYFFGRAEALTPSLPTVAGPSCHQPAEKTKLIQCKPAGSPRR